MMHTAQMFLDDVGVVVSMVSITLLALIVVIFKVLIFDPSVGILLKETVSGEFIHACIDIKGTVQKKIFAHGPVSLTP
jgi:hypothetical protein